MILKKKKIIAIAFLISILIFVAFSFAYGRLLPFSPVIFGFEHKSYEKVGVYYHKGDNSPLMDGIDKFLSPIEKIHNLKFQKKVDILLCKSDTEKKRLTGSLTRAQTFPLKGRIIISKRLQKEALKGIKPFDVYLKHELSHSLTEQNMSFSRSLTFPGWFNEGLAVYSANQFGKGGYFGKREVSEHIAQGIFFHPHWWVHPLQQEPIESKEFKLKKGKYPFIYSEFGCIVDDLINTYGRSLFIVYYHQLLKNKENDQLFKKIFGISFSVYLDDFKKRMVSKIS